MRARWRIAWVLVGALCVTAWCGAQQQNAAPGTAQNSATQPREKDSAKPKKLVKNRDSRRAAELYLEAGKLFEKEKFAEAQREYQQAAELDPGDADYPVAAEVARSHRVTQLIQQAAKDRLRGKSADALTELRQARDLDPHNALVQEHLYELAADTAPEPQGIYSETGRGLGPAPELEPQPGRKSFHVHADTWQVIQQVYHAFGIEATIDTSVQPKQVRLDIDNATYEQATQALELVTDTFAVALDPHRALLARDTLANRKQFERLEVETVYLPGLSAKELQDIGNLAKTVFDAKQIAL